MLTGVVVFAHFGSWRASRRAETFFLRMVLAFSALLKRGHLGSGRLGSGPRGPGQLGAGKLGARSAVFTTPVHKHEPGSGQPGANISGFHHACAQK